MKRWMIRAGMVCMAPLLGVGFVVAYLAIWCLFAVMAMREAWSAVRAGISDDAVQLACWVRIIWQTAGEKKGAMQRPVPDNRWD